MNFIEAAAKPLLAAVGIPVPRSYVVNTLAGVEQAQSCSARAWSRRRCRPASAARPAASSSPTTPKPHARHAERILKLTIGGYKVERLLIEESVPIAG